MQAAVASPQETNGHSTDASTYGWDEYHKPDPTVAASSAPDMSDIGKALLNATGSAVKQLEPIKYPWAFHMYRQQMAQFWLPTEVPMQDDLRHWRDDSLSDADREAIKTTLAMFACIEFSVTDNLAINLYRLLTNPECRMFLLAQGAIEAVHQQAYSLMVETLGVDKESVYSGHRTMRSVKEKTLWADNRTAEISSPFFKTDTLENRRAFLLNVIAYLLMEGISFMGGFAVLAYFRAQRNLMPGLAEQILYIARDETLHCKFATMLAVELCREEPELWNRECMETTYQMGQDVLEMEREFVRQVVPNGLPGVSREGLESHMEHLMSRRLEPFSLSEFFQGKRLKWLDEVLGLRMERNFFETTVTEYSKGGLQWN